MRFQEAWRLCTYHRYVRTRYKEMLRQIWLPTACRPSWPATRRAAACSVGASPANGFNQVCCFCLPNRVLAEVGRTGPGSRRPSWTLWGALCLQHLLSRFPLGETQPLGRQREAGSLRRGLERLPHPDGKSAATGRRESRTGGCSAGED